MRYFVTGGTGFIVRFFPERLTAREGRVYGLIRRESHQKDEAASMVVEAAAAHGEKPAEELRASGEQLALTALVKGVRFR